MVIKITPKDDFSTQDCDQKLQIRSSERNVNNAELKIVIK